MSSLLLGSPLDQIAVNTASRRSKPTSVAAMNRAKDIAPLEFKICACMYALMQGGPLKPKADACGLGVSTLRGWLDSFADAVISEIKPKHMPCTPITPEARQAIRGNFASRRGLSKCELACDGTHLAFKPKNAIVASDYRNFKGWTSILCVAFVDSFYRFFDVDVGYPGKAGDNTVLRNNWFMLEISKDHDKWLGTDGVILGDSGASDADGVFLNPYHAPVEPEKLWFNFCHSSTRFFVEQTFGIWKSRFRFLLDPLRVRHKLHVKLVYTSAILHNMLIVLGQDNGQVLTEDANVSWSQFFALHEKDRCPQCAREGKKHCIHQTVHRNGGAQVSQARSVPSALRDEMCNKLWRDVLCGPSRDEIERLMNKRC